MLTDFVLPTVAGALESLCALAHAHLELGFSSPFLVRQINLQQLSRSLNWNISQYTPRPHTQPSLSSIRAILRDVVGARIVSEGTPRGLGPVILGVTGHVFSGSPSTSDLTA